MKYLLLFSLIGFLVSCHSDETGIISNSRHNISVQHTVKSTDLSTNTSILEWVIKNDGSQDLEADGWHLYFSQIALTPNQSSIPKTVIIENVKGDIQRLTAGPDFRTLSSGDSIVFEFETKYPILRQSFLPAALYLAYEDGSSFPIENVSYTPFTDEIRQALGAPTAEDIYAQNESIGYLPEFNMVSVLPRPKSFMHNGSFLHYNGRINIVYDKAFQNEADQLEGYLNEVFTGTIQQKQSSNASLNDGIFLIKMPDNSMPKEAYRLEVAATGISILAAHQAGLFYGMQTIRQLISLNNIKSPSDKLSVKNAKISDQPRFDYRGLMLDVSRNFHDKETVLNILDLMAIYKLNKFHFHLTDDEGWRIEIDGLPELTTVGAYRGHTTDESDKIFPFYASGPNAKDSYGSGFYTKEDFIEILEYATERHIEVIPEIDMPGHMRAAIKAMAARYNHYMNQGELGDEAKAREYLIHDFDDESEYSSAQGYNDNTMCVCQESSFTFIEKIVDELVLMYNAAGAPFTTFHTGGDEVPYGAWQKSPTCKKFISESTEVNSADDLTAYTIKRLKEILGKHNLISAGWEEILLRHGADGHNTTEINPEFVGDNVQAYVWNAIWGGGREEMGYKLANMGYPIVISNSAQLYLDMAYNKDPDETGLSWSGYTDTKGIFDLVPFDLYKTARVDNIAEFVKGKTAITEKGKQNILGIQGQIWSETIRNEDLLYYMMLPKFLSLSERAWAAPRPWESSSASEILKDQESDWTAFINLVGRIELPKLDHWKGEGLPYRIPLPGAKVVDGMLYANSLFPGLEIRYSTDGSGPTQESNLYTEPIGVGERSIQLRAFTTTGRGSRVSFVN